MNPDLTDEVYDFMMNNFSKYLTWKEDILRAYIGFYRSRGWLGIVREKGKIIGIGMARPISLLKIKDQYEDRYACDENGDVIFIDEICVTETKAIPLLWSMMLGALGKLPFVASIKRQIGLRIWKMERYQKKMTALLNFNLK